MNMNTQLTKPSGYNISNLIFSKPISCTIPNSNVGYKRVNLSTINPDKSAGDLIFGTEMLFSFGVSVNRDFKTQEANGYTLPICLWNKDGPTDEEKAFTNTLDSIVEKIQEYLLSIIKLVP